MRAVGLVAEQRAAVLLVGLEVALEPRDCESPSNASTCVATRSRNQRSWEMTTAQPANASSASSSARSVSTSRSLVGSSSSSTLPPERRSLARCRRLRSPPESLPTFFCWSEPLKFHDEQYAREFIVRSPTLIWSMPPEISSQTFFSSSSASRDWST